MCGEEVGGDDSLSGEFDLTFIWNIWKPLGNEETRRAACTAVCTHTTELERSGFMVSGKG